MYDSGPFKKRKTDYVIENEEVMEVPPRDLRQIENSSCTEPPKPEEMESQESPLDFSRKSGSDSSISPPLEPHYSKPRPSTVYPINEAQPTWKSARQSPDNPSHHREPPVQNGFVASDVSLTNGIHSTWKSASESLDDPIPQLGILPPVHNGFSDASTPNYREEMEQDVAEIHKPQPTKIPTNGDIAHWLEQNQNGMRSHPMSVMGKYGPECYRKLDAKTPYRMSLTGFSSRMNPVYPTSNEYFYGRPYSHYSTNLGYPLTPTCLTNGSSPLLIGARGAATDKRFSKNNRPFKVLESEILSYDPVSSYSFNPVSFPSSRIVETSPRLSPVISPQARNGNQDVTSSLELSGHSNSSGALEDEQDCQNDSDESQLSNSQLIHQDGHESDPNQSTRKKGQKFPDELKDKAYYDKRRKNNEAAKRSRDARRRKEDEIALRAKLLMDQNKELQYKLMAQNERIVLLEKEIDSLKKENYAAHSDYLRVKREFENFKQHVSFNGVMGREKSKEVNGENHRQ